VARSMADVSGLREVLRAATSVVVLTGAGISAESGVPIFRGVGGLWRNYSPESLATPEAFAKDPRLVWEWYDWRRQVIHRAQPNAGHRALVELEHRIATLPPSESSFTLVTQNVDGLHDRAGSREVLKLHGDIWLVRCTACGTWERNEDVPLKELPPRCRCGGVLRPGVVWFGETLPTAEWEGASQACAGTQVMIIVGTSAVVYPAAGLAELARAAAAKLAIINLEPTPLDRWADWVLTGKAGEILPGLL
jgi:NAD-dependent deacetylase